MKYIRLFETQAERAAANMVPPYLIYTKEGDTLEIEDVAPINSVDTPELMTLVYSWGWSENPNYMTARECAAVTDAQFATKGGTSSTNSQFVGVPDLSCLQYFTGLTDIPSYYFKGCTACTKIIFPENIETIGLFIFAGNAIAGAVDLSRTKITRLPGMYTSGVGCTGVKGMSLPASVYYLGDGNNAHGVWDGANGRTTNWVWFKFPNTSLVCPTRGSMGTNNKSILRIYVPDELVATYKADNSATGDSSSTGRYINWSTFANQIYPISQWQTDVDNGIIVA